MCKKGRASTFPVVGLGSFVQEVAFTQSEFHRDSSVLVCYSTFFYFFSISNSFIISAQGPAGSAEAQVAISYPATRAKTPFWVFFQRSMAFMNLKIRKIFKYVQGIFKALRALDGFNVWCKLQKNICIIVDNG